MKTINSVFLIGIFLITGIAYSQSGWQIVSDSVPDLWLESIQMTSANTGYACGWYPTTSSGSILKTTNGGLNWQRTDYITNNVDDVCFLNDLTGYFIGWSFLPGFFHGHIYKTTDGCSTWARHDSIQEGNFFRIKFLDVNTGLVAGKYGQAFFTTNGGVNWVNRSIMNLWHEPQCIWCLNADTWFVGDGLKLSRTTNQGLNWIRDDSLPASTFYFLNQTTGIMGCGNTGFVYKTTNAGVNWLRICDTSLGWSQSMIFTNSSTGYNARYGYHNIYKTTNGGYNWTEQFVDQNNLIFSLSFLNNFTGFAAGISGRIFRTTNGGSVFVANISSEVPDKFELGQNYPNPFNQFSILNFKCKIKSMVSLNVFDMTGREVQTLVNETLAPGTYQVRFDGSGLASGLYYYSMSIDGKQTAVKKMVMVK